MDRMQQDGGDTLSVPDVGRIALATLDALPARVCVIDETGRIIVTNKAWREFGEKIICGCPDCGSQPCPDSHWIMPCWSHKTADEVSQAVQDMQAGKRTSFSIEYECHASDAARSFATHIACLPDCSPAMLLISHDDISERRRAEDAQHKSAKRLKRLGAHMESVREEQSAMIARELHDEIAQTLTALSISLQLAARTSGVSRAQRLVEAQRLGEELSQRIRQLSLDLRPPMLDDLGLLPTLLWYFDRCNQQLRVQVEFEHQGLEQPLDAEIEIVVYRIVQEALTNIARHAGVRAASVRLWANPTTLSVQVEDRGSGFDIGQTLAQRVEPGGQPVGVVQGVETDPQTSAVMAAITGQVIFQRRDVVEYSLRMPVEGQACLGG